jgi:hypothetical protein
VAGDNKATLMGVIQRLGMDWEQDEHTDKALAVVEAIITAVNGDFSLLIKLFQVLCVGDERDADRPSLSWLVGEMHAVSPTLGRGDRLGWARALALAVLHHAGVFGHHFEVSHAMRDEVARTLPNPRWVALLDEALSTLSDGMEELPALDFGDVTWQTLDQNAENTCKIGRWMQPRLNLLWWAEAGWSDSARLLWDDLTDPHTKAAAMVEDFIHLAPAHPSAHAFLLRTLRKEGVKLDEDVPLHVHSARWRRARETPELRHLRWLEFRGEREELVRAEGYGLPASRARLGLPVVDPDRLMTARAWHLAVAREGLMHKYCFGAA